MEALPDAVRCPHCGQDLPAEAFAVDRSRSNGHRSWCKPCEAARNRARYRKALGRPVRPYTRAA
jgi:hypothetical protein